MLRIELDRGLREGLGRFIADRATPPQAEMDVEAAVNVIVRDWLQGQGYLPLPTDADETTTAIEAAGVPEG